MDANQQPLNDTERAIAEIWKEVLDVPGTITAADSFFGLGGDSVGMITLMFRVQEDLCVELPPEAILAAPTLGEFAAMVDAVSNGTDALP